MWILFEKKNLLLENKAQYKAEDLVDKMDIAIRLLLSHLRAMKQKESLKQKVYRSLSHEDQVCRGCTYVFRVCFFVKIVTEQRSVVNTYIPKSVKNNQEA